MPHAPAVDPPVPEDDPDALPDEVPEVPAVDEDPEVPPEELPEMVPEDVDAPELVPLPEVPLVVVRGADWSEQPLVKASAILLHATEHNRICSVVPRAARRRVSFCCVMVDWAPYL
jgi:hypothetical protein